LKSKNMTNGNPLAWEPGVQPGWVTASHPRVFVIRSPGHDPTRNPNVRLGLARLFLLFSPARASSPGPVQCSSGRAGRPPIFLGVRGWRRAGFQFVSSRRGAGWCSFVSNPGLRAWVRVPRAVRASARVVRIPSPGWLRFAIVLAGDPWLSRAQEGWGGGVVSQVYV
jgi:hypothetical protein